MLTAKGQKKDREAAESAGASLFQSEALFFWLNHYCEVLFLPVVGISITLWYVDLRVRREAADLVEGEITLA